MALDADQSPLQPTGVEPSITDEAPPPRQPRGSAIQRINVPGNRWQLVTEEESDENAVKEINELLSREDYTSAYPRLSVLADKDYQNPNINVVTGLVALSVGEKNDAARYFERALQADPFDADSLYNGAVLAMSNGDIETAQSCFERLVKIHLVDASVYNNLAVIWMNKGNVAKVKEFFTKSLELNPNFEPARKDALEFAVSNNMLEWGMELLDFNNKQSGLTSSTIKDIHHWIKVIANEQQRAASSDRTNIGY